MMPELKLVWRVQAAPTGRYRSFQDRGWPIAYYNHADGWPAAFLHCADEYRPSRVREGRHGPITVRLCHHNDPNKAGGWGIRVAKVKSATLEEAKALVEKLLLNHLEFHPTKERK